MTTPGYNPKTPLPDDTIADSQSSFLDNFSTLFTAFAQNHVSLNAAANAGNHNLVEMVETPPQNAPSTKEDEIAIYVKKAAGSTDQIWMRYPLNGKEFQLTEYQIFPIPELKEKNVPFQIPFFSFLPGGVIVYFGKVFPAVTPEARPFPINLFPAICRNVMGVNICPIGGVNANIPQPNVTFTINNLNIITSINLTSVAATTLPDCYYLIFGNMQA